MQLKILSRLVRVVESFIRRGFGSWQSSSISGGSVQSGNHLERVETFLKSALWYINPHVVVEGEKKLSKRVVACICLLLYGLFSSLAYTIERVSGGENVDLSEKAELVAIALVYTRCVCYFVPIFVLGSRMRSFIQKIIVDRESTRSSATAWQLTLEYSRKEFTAAMAFAFYLAIFGVFIIFSPALMPNQFALLYNFKILLLPFDDVFSATWYFSYWFQIFIEILLVSFYVCFVSLMLHFMDHSCWTIDNLKILVEELRSSCQHHDRNDPESVKSVQKQLKEIVRKSYEALEWQNGVRNLLQYMFLLDFSLQAVMTGLSLNNLTNSVKASIVCYVVPLIALPQIFCSCWMGERYASRVEKLTAAVYDLPWYLMDAKRRKEVQMVLMMSQNMQGFDGIFYRVNMETFKDVINFTYSLFTLMSSMK